MAKLAKDTSDLHRVVELSGMHLERKAALLRGNQTTRHGLHKLATTVPNKVVGGAHMPWLRTLAKESRRDKRHAARRASNAPPPIQVAQFDVANIPPVLTPGAREV